MPIFGPKCQFWAKFGRFWAPNPIFWAQRVKVLVPSYRDSNETPFSSLVVRVTGVTRGDGTEEGKGEGREGGEEILADGRTDQSKAAKGSKRTGIESTRTDLV